jgi:hypothetical protein
VPTIHQQTIIVGGHGPSALSPPSYGAWLSSTRVGLVGPRDFARCDATAAARGAMRSAARRRGGVAQGPASLCSCCSQHHLISGRTLWSVPTFRMLAVRKPRGWDPSTKRHLCWPEGGTVTIHPAQTAALAATLACRSRSYAAALSTAPSGTRPVVRKRHSATMSLRASATMAMRRMRPRPWPVRAWNQRLSALSG